MMNISPKYGKNIISDLWIGTQLAFFFWPVPTREEDVMTILDTRSSPLSHLHP